MVKKISRFDVVWVTLDPTQGAELQKTRPCVVISPDSMNLSRLKTVIVAPMTSVVRAGFPTRIAVEFKEKSGQIALDQLRVIDRSRIFKKVGMIESTVVQAAVLRTLQVLFS